MTSHIPRYTKEEFARRGDALYEGQIRAVVASETNMGKIVAVDIETGKWAMDADEMTASRTLKAQIPDAQIWLVRVGSRYLRRFGARPNSYPGK